jgi:hypothetical protein
MEPEVAAIEVFENGGLHSKQLPINLTAERLGDLIRNGVAVFDSGSGRDPNLHYEYDHYVVT